MDSRAARRAGRLGCLVVLVVLVAACERSSEPGGDQPRRPPATTTAGAAPAGLRIQEYPVPAGSRPHVEVVDAPRGRGPYGSTTTPDGQVFSASLAGSHSGRLDHRTGAAAVLEPPTGGQGARRVWSDSHGRIWVSEWNAGQLGRYDPADGGWREWTLPGANPMAYAVYVDHRDHPWLSDFAANALVRFDPATERFTVVALPSSPANLRQLLGRPGQVWGAESAADKLVVVRTG